MAQRYEFIRDEIEHYISALVELHDTTDPSGGQATETDKLEKARRAVELWWYLGGRVLLWAQSQIAGYELVKEEPLLAEKLQELIGGEFTGDSHILEYLGLCFQPNPPERDDPLLLRVEDAADGFELSDAGMRSLIRELLDSRCASNSFWRFELGRALHALEHGQVRDLVKPARRKPQGDVLELRYAKLRAIQHVQFKVGAGYKKHVALASVAEELGQSIETLRSWEKDLRRDEDMAHDIRAAYNAGIFQREYKGLSVSDLEAKFDYSVHRNESDFSAAERAKQTLDKNPVSAVRDRLRAARRG